MEANKKNRAAGILFFHRNEMLLLKRAGSDEHGAGKWALPGGMSEGDETALETAIRESQEELGLLKVLGKNVGSVDNEVFTTFLYKSYKKFTVRLSKEHSDWGWVNFDEVRRKPLLPEFEQELDQYLKIIKENS